MEFKVKIEGKEKTITLSNPTGGDQKKYLGKGENLTTESLEKNPRHLLDFIEWQDEFILRLANGTLKNIKELDAMDMPDKRKMIDWIQNQFKVMGDVQKK